MHLNTCAATGPIPKAFFTLPAGLAAEDPRTLPPNPAAETAQLRHHAARLYWVEDQGWTLARCATGFRPDPGTAWLGFFAARPYPEAAALLFAAAEADLRAQGIRTVLGPLNADTWHDYRLNLQPAGPPPFLREPWNPPDIPALWEQQGYEICDRYLSARIRDLPAALERLRPFRRRVERQGGSFQPLNLRRFSAELDRLHALSLTIFADNPHYTPIEPAAFRALYAPARPLLRPELCGFAIDAQGRDTGFVFAYPDQFQALRAMRGRRSLAARLRYLRHRQKDRICIKSLGCTPAARGAGVAPALMAYCLEAAIALGASEALMCLMHAANDSRRLDGGTSEPFREYALYRKTLIP